MIWKVLQTEPFGSQASEFWIVNGLMIPPILACAARALLGGPRRAGAVWLGLAMTSYAAGNVIFVGWTQHQATPPVPSPADVAYLLVYPFIAAAIVSLLRSEEGAIAKRLWLDGALGAAGAATALAAVLSPTLVSTGEEIGPVLVGAAFSVGDLLLIAMIFGVLAVRGMRGGSMWLWLGAGLATFCAADVAYTLQVAAETFVVGTFWGTLWVIGLTVAAASLWRPERPVPHELGRSTAMLAIPSLAVLTALVVLVVSSFDPMPVAVVVLATLTLGLATIRTFLAFHQVRRLSDAHRQAVTDDLTGLGNRRALFEIGEDRMDEAAPNDRIALMLLDLNDFKEVNDSYGHHAGDELLREVGRRLVSRVRHPDLLVRLGGDEFALVLKLEPDEDGLECAGLILDRINQPVVIDGVRIRVDASAGMSEIRRDEASVSELLRRADVAMYAAKGEGSRLRLYEARLDENNRSRLRTIHELDAAIAHDQFILHFQPKFDVAAGTIVGAEALVRWQHPTRGLLYPDTFLPLVEQCGLMGALTRRVLRLAVGQVAHWRSSGLSTRVAVNLSASDLLDDRLAEHILAILAESDVPPDALELELTESVFMTDPERARTVLDRLQALGFRIAVDDYGTGYCALAYLRDLPIDELKIDRSFISDMTDGPRSVAIVRSTIELAHALELEVVAEGVEDEITLQTLTDFGCDFAQGYHFSRPLPAAEFAAYVAEASATLATPA